MVTADSATAIADIGFPIEVRYEDDSIDTTDVARVVAAARLDRHDQRFEEFVASDHSRRRPAHTARRGTGVDVSAA